MGKLRTVVIKRSTLVWRNSMKNIRKGDISKQPNDIASAIRVSKINFLVPERSGIKGMRLIMRVLGKVRD